MGNVFTRKLFATAGALAAVATLMTAAPAHAAGIVPCGPSDYKVFRIFHSNGSKLCIAGRGRFERDMRDIVKVSTGHFSGAFDYLDSDGYMTTQPFQRGGTYNLNRVVFHSVYLDPQ